MADRIDLPPELAAEREALRRQHAIKLNGGGDDLKLTAEEWDEVRKLVEMSPFDRSN